MIGSITQEEVLEYVRTHPGCSAREISAGVGQDPRSFNTDRKLRQLFRWGYVTCETVRPPKGNRYLVWRCIE